MISISEEFKKYNYTFNRSLSSDITLPYVENDILVGVNELANGTNFNTSLNLLQSNLMYLYSISKFANPDLPKDYKGWMGKKIDTENSTKLKVTLTGTFFRSGLQFNADGSVNANTIPYFTIRNYDGKNHNFIFTWTSDTKNPAVDNLPNGTDHTINLSDDFNGDEASAKEVARLLNANNFTATYSSQGVNQKIVIELKEIGGVFNQGQSPDIYRSVLGENVNVLIEGGEISTTFIISKTPFTDVVKSLNNYDDLNNFSISKANLPDFQNLFLCSSTEIQCLSADLKGDKPSDYNFVTSTKTYGKYNELTFNDINSSVVFENNLYVCDNGNKNIVKLNINGFTFNDTIRKNKFYETEIIGGEGGIRDNYSFQDPEICTFYDGNLYVLDRGNQTFKVYDKDLGFVRNIRKQQTFKKYNPVKVKIYKDQFYWLNEIGQLVIFDLDLNFISETDLRINDEDSFIDFIICPDNNNLYALTSRNVYKYFLDSKQYIGKFILKDGAEHREFSFFESIDLGDNFDNIFLYNKDNGKGNFLVFKEDGNFLELLSDYDFDIFTKEELHLNKNEFASNFAYNKAINKTIKNIFQLRNFIVRKTNLALTRDGELLYDGVSYFNVEDLAITNFKTNFNNYIGTNEIFSRSVINRVLSELYRLQSLLLDLFKSNIKSPERQPVYLGGPDVAGNCLMLEPWPGEPNSYIMLENQGVDDFNVVLLEYALVPENKNVKDNPWKEEPPAPPVTVEEVGKEIFENITDNNDSGTNDVDGDGDGKSDTPEEPEQQAAES